MIQLLYGIEMSLSTQRLRDKVASPLEPAGDGLFTASGGLCAYRIALVRPLSRPFPPLGQPALSAHAGRCGPSPKRLHRSHAEQRLDVLIGRHTDLFHFWPFK